MNEFYTARFHFFLQFGGHEFLLLLSQVFDLIRIRHGISRVPPAKSIQAPIRVRPPIKQPEPDWWNSPSPIGLHKARIVEKKTHVVGYTTSAVGYTTSAVGQTTFRRRNHRSSLCDQDNDNRTEPFLNHSRKVVPMEEYSHIGTCTGTWLGTRKGFLFRAISSITRNDFSTVWVNPE